MKKLQQLCIAGVFTLVLTTATYAGDIATGGSPQPPPPSRSPSITQGQIDSVGNENAQVMSDSVADIALNLLQTMLSVF